MDEPEKSSAELASAAMDLKLWLQRHGMGGPVPGLTYFAMNVRYIQEADMHAISIMAKYSSRTTGYTPWSRHRAALVRALEPLILYEFHKSVSCRRDRYLLEHRSRISSKLVCDMLNLSHDKVTTEELSTAVSEAVSDPNSTIQLELLGEILENLKMQLLK